MLRVLILITIFLSLVFNQASTSLGLKTSFSFSMATKEQYISKATQAQPESQSAPNTTPSSDDEYPVASNSNTDEEDEQDHSKVDHAKCLFAKKEIEFVPSCKKMVRIEAKFEPWLITGKMDRPPDALA
jgi:hypothetical protein